MKVLLINGSSNLAGSTFTALFEVAKTLEAEGVGTEIFQLGGEPIRDCTGCGGCARSCPLGNIAMQPGGTPHWGNRCAMCLRCYHSCPRNAVAYGKATAGKGRYMAPKDI